jgi:hypothetical protein
MSRRSRLSSNGLRVSASGFDAATATDDGLAITFDSNWTDIAKISAVGVASEVVVNVITGTNIFGLRAFYPNLGFKPFIEMRRLAGTVVFDDFWDSTFPSGGYAIVEATQATVTFGQGPSNLGLQALFVAYQIPVPSQ